MAARAIDIIKSLAPTISVGVLTADVMKLGEELSAIEGTGAGILHFDVMDGVFCPLMTFGASFIKGIKTDLLKDVHLTIADPLNKMEEYVKAGADILTVYLESEPTHIHRVFQSMAKMTNANDPERGIVRGVAVNPGTPVSMMEPLLDDIDVITILGINPGWGGQGLISSVGERVAQTQEMIKGRDILICVDGGVTQANIAEVTAMGVDMVVTGSAVFDGKTPHDNAIFMLEQFRKREKPRVGLREERK